MTKDIDTKEIHTILLNIAKEFHRICIKHDIPYYMIGGTMLGAIRHKGFIPWDDDMDFGIPREHYDKFIQIASKELTNYYQLHTIDNSAYALMGISKIADMRTRIQEEYAPKTKESIGINIDIFPLDETNSKITFFSKNKIIELLVKLQKILFIDYNSRQGIPRNIAFILQELIKISPKKNVKLINDLIRKKSKSATNSMWANYFGAYGCKEIISKNIFGQPTLYQFEDTSFYGVNDYKSYLKQLYSKYWILPPEGKRRIHHKIIEKI